MPPSPPKPTSRRPRGSPREASIIVVVVALATASNAAPAPFVRPIQFFLARHAAARVPGASARPRSACEIAPRHCVRVACLVRSLENKHAGSQRQYSRTGTMLFAAQRSSRQCSSTAACSLIKRTQSHSWRSARTFCVATLPTIRGPMRYRAVCQCAVDVCECMPAQLYASARLLSSRNSD